jgi:hypothetical protein
MDPGVHLLIGAMNRGKSTTVFDWLDKTTPAKASIVYGYPGFDEIYGRRYPMYDISDEFDILFDVSDGQTVVMDDRMYDLEIFQEKWLINLFKTSKKRGIRLYITMQYAMGIPYRLRKYVDSVCIFRENYSGSRRRIYDMYGFGTFDEFNELLSKTFNYEERYIDVYLHICLNPLSYTVDRVKR